MGKKTCETCGHAGVCFCDDQYLFCGDELPRWEPAGLEDEVARLRAIFPPVLAALRNGSKCSADVSVEFLETIPNEVQEEVNSLRDNLATNAMLLARQCDLAREAEVARDALLAEVARLRATPSSDTETASIGSDCDGKCSNNAGQTPTRNDIDADELCANVERLRSERLLLRAAAITLLVRLDLDGNESPEKSMLKRTLIETAGTGGE